MGNKLYVGNLPFSATEDVLKNRFAECGLVESVKVIVDRDTGQSKGFAFVEMSSGTEAQAVITKFNGADCDGRQMKINEAKPMEKSGFKGNRAKKGW